MFSKSHKIVNCKLSIVNCQLSIVNSFSKRVLFLSIFIFQLSIVNSFSQNEIDALRYSWLSTGGTARYQGLAGAMGAVGGDPSCMAVNPAGLARFTKSDFTLSFATSQISTATLYNETTSYHGKGNFGLNNLAIVGAFKNPDENEWKSVQFAIGYQKLANFNNAIYMSGPNGNSLLDQFAGDANGTAPQNLGDNFPYTASLAYEAYLIDPDLSTTNDDYTTQLFGSSVKQSRSILKKGSYGETNIAISGNYMDKWYLGMSVGFPTMRYKEEYIHNEIPDDTSISLQSFDYTQYLFTRGNGINLKIGTIFTPVEWLRLGLALQTRSSIGLTDEWNNSMHSKFDGGIQYDTTSENGIYNYRLKTPGRATLSAAVVFSKWGLISVDYEYLNYGRAKFKPDNFYGSAGYSFNEENLTIKTIYGSASNIRVGLEGRYNWITARGGISIYGNPFMDGTTTVDPTKITYSAGLGFRIKGFYADLGWNLTKWNEAYFMYDPILVNTANIGTSFKQFVLTTGFRF